MATGGFHLVQCYIGIFHQSGIFRIIAKAICKNVCGKEQELVKSPKHEFRWIWVWLHQLLLTDWLSVPLRLLSERRLGYLFSCGVGAIGYIIQVTSCSVSLVVNTLETWQVLVWLFVLVLKFSPRYLSPCERNSPYVRINITSIRILSQRYLSII